MNRDIALQVSRNVPSEDLFQTIKQEGGDILANVSIFVIYSLWKQDCKGLLIIIQYFEILSNHSLRPQPTTLKFFDNHFKNFSKSAGEKTPAIFVLSNIVESYLLWKHWGNFLRQLLL